MWITPKWVYQLSCELKKGQVQKRYDDELSKLSEDLELFSEVAVTDKPEKHTKISSKLTGKMQCGLFFAISKELQILVCDLDRIEVCDLDRIERLPNKQQSRVKVHGKTDQKEQSEEWQRKRNKLKRPCLKGRVSGVTVLLLVGCK